MKRLFRVAAALLAAGLLGSYVSQPAYADDHDQQGKLLLLLDSSGSMKEPDGSGGTKIDAAKQALNTVVDRLPADSQVGLRVYGATVFSAQDEGACSDSQLVVPIGPADKPALKQAIAGYRPYGETPIAHSLRQAAKDVGTEGRRTILLVSDGEETCKPDPCLVAEEIRQQGIDLKVDVVGLRVDGKAREQLQCIADEGGGTYYDAADAEDLAAGLEQSSMRAFRPFSIEGEPVRGTLEPTAEAPELQPGQYTDTLGGYVEDDSTKYYRIPYAEGSTLHFAVTARPEEQGTTDAMSTKLLTPDGTQCATGQHTPNDQGWDHTVITASMVFRPEATPECAEQSTLVLEVKRGLHNAQFAPDTGELPFELLMIEEPPLRDGQALPEAFAEDELVQESVPQQEPQGDVVGGASFNDAPTLEPGTWTDTIQTGEMLFYRVRADWGQAPAMTFRMFADPEIPAMGLNALPVEAYAYAPDRSRIGLATTEANTAGLYRSNRTSTWHMTLPPVRYQNRAEDSFHEGSVAPASLAGDYYFAIRLGKRDEQLQVPVEISVQVTGKRGGEPAYAGAEPATSGNDDKGSEPKPADERAGDQDTENAARTGPDHTVRIALIAGAGVLVIAGVTLAVYLLRRPTGGG